MSHRRPTPTPPYPTPHPPGCKKGPIGAETLGLQNSQWPEFSKREWPWSTISPYSVVLTHGNDVRRGEWIVFFSGTGKIAARICDESVRGQCFAEMLCAEMNKGALGSDLSPCVFCGSRGHSVGHHFDQYWWIPRPDLLKGSGS